MLPGFKGLIYPTAVEPSARWYEPGTDPVEITMSKDGWIEVPQTPGVRRLIDLSIYGRIGKEMPR